MSNLCIYDMIHYYELQKRSIIGGKSGKQCFSRRLYRGVSTLLQHTATHYNTLPTHCSIHTLQHAATHCTTLHHTAPHCNTSQDTTAHCATLQYIATHYNTQQHTATHLQLATTPHCNIPATRYYTPA